ncbi:MAG: OmpA family protein [Alphaproteobacteria bacterium]|nr:OmpA family protein [Alphaproteobacteria bacterium]
MKGLPVCLILAISWIGGVANAAELVSPFAGSKLLGEYKTDFDRFQYLSTRGKKDETLTVEGRIVSRLYTKPSKKSTFEVFRSYENELKAAGFKMFTAIGNGKRRVQRITRRLGRKKGNRIEDRAYTKRGKRIPASPISYVVTFGEHYIAARKTVAGTDILVVVVIADRKDAYTVDVVESAAMEQNTVALSLDSLRSQMASNGRVAVYGILFDTGSAKIRPDSNAALKVIAQYLRENPKRSFYVVGHTDDKGRLSGNMKLSEARAAASKKALVKLVPAAAAKLSSYGVGPLSPVAANNAPKGRQLNRRVELVGALK